MSTETLALIDTPVDPAFDELLQIDAATADLLFREARTVNAFDDAAVTDQQVQAAYDLVRWGPTMMNSVPLRLLLVRSPEARERLASHLAEGNRAKTLAAPLTIVVAADSNFHAHLPLLAPHKPEAQDMFEAAGTENRAATARVSALIQTGYLVVGLRAAGLHVGPMSGFDPAGIDAEFFGENGWKSLLVLNVGTPATQGASHPRQARLTFDQASLTA